MDKRPRRIAVLSVHGCPMVQLGGKYRGGMNLYIRELYRELGQAGVEVDIYSRRHDPLDPEVVPLGDRARTIHITAGEEREVPRETILAGLSEFVQGVVDYSRARGLEYDLIHSHYWLSGLAGLELQSRWRVPHVTSFHTLGKLKNESFRWSREPRARIEAEARVMAGADRVLALTAIDRDFMSRLYEVPATRVAVVPAGVDTGLFRPLDRAQARHALGLDGQKVILLVGRIEPLKGIDILLRALPILGERNRLRVLIAGADSYSDDELLSESGSEQGRLEALAQALGLDQMVSFLGPVDHERLPIYYNAADVCVIPSFYESFGMVALEAMACGTPVVASRVGGLQVTVRDGVTGYLIPWQCPEPFAERLEVLLSNEALARGLGAAGRAAMERYTWTRVAREVLTFYDQVLARRGPA
ncbi:MAG: glycosyltransferase [Chloroflexi bacterium]|nr:glycosyltransferase [Chloroflexota bacterium]